MQLTNNYRKGEQVGTTLKALRAYKEDLDQAITAFSIYASTHERRGVLEMPAIKMNQAAVRERRTPRRCA